MHCKKITSDKDFVLNIRVTQKEYDYIVRFSDLLGISKSDFVRMVIDKNICLYEGSNRNENKKTDFNN